MVIQVDVDGLALTEGTEGHHVLVRVERHAAECCGVAQLRVHCQLVTWENTQDIHQAV